MSETDKRWECKRDVHTEGFSYWYERDGKEADPLHVLAELNAAESLKAERERAKDLVRAFCILAKRNHYECEDGWYSCPKSEDGCANDNAGKDCTCGADDFNKMLEIFKREIFKGAHDGEKTE